MRVREILYNGIPLLILLCITWVKASAMLARVTDPDPGLFEAFAYHLQHGKILYADIWDHKPPLIFYLNLGFLTLFGPTENAISYGSLFFCLLQTAVFYLLLQNVFKNRVHSFLGTLFFIGTFFSVFTFGSGNYTEQYGVLGTTSGLLLLLLYRKTEQISYIWWSGICYGIAWWFKEPFALSALPVFILLIVNSIQKKQTFPVLVKFTISFFLPAFILCNLMALTGSWDGYKEHLAHSKNYALFSQGVPLWLRLQDNISGFIHMFPISRWLFLPLYILGIVALFLKKETRIVAALVLGQQVADYFATGMSGNRFFHYYLQSLPLTILVLIAAPIAIGDMLKKVHFVFRPIPLIAFVLAFFMVQKPWENLAWNPEKKYADPILTYLKDHEYYKPRSIAMGGKDIGFYLLRAEGISNQRYIVPYPYHWIPMKGKRKNYRMSKDSATFKENMPDYVIFSGTWAEMYQDCGLDSFVLQNYTEVALTDMMPGATAHLLKKKQEAEGSGE
jgi:hypothetical protein